MKWRRHTLLLSSPVCQYLPAWGQGPDDHACAIPIPLGLGPGGKCFGRSGLQMASPWNKYPLVDGATTLSVPTPGLCRLGGAYLRVFSAFLSRWLGMEGWESWAAWRPPANLAAPGGVQLALWRRGCYLTEASHLGMFRTLLEPVSCLQSGGGGAIMSSSLAT